MHLKVGCKSTPQSIMGASATRVVQHLVCAPVPRERDDWRSPQRQLPRFSAPSTAPAIAQIRRASSTCFSSQRGRLLRMSHRGEAGLAEILSAPRLSLRGQSSMYVRCSCCRCGALSKARARGLCSMCLRVDVGGPKGVSTCVARARGSSSAREGRRRDSYTTPVH